MGTLLERFSDTLKAPPPLRVNLPAAEIIAACAARGVTLRPGEREWELHLHPTGILTPAELGIVTQLRVDLYAALTGTVPQYGLCCACDKRDIESSAYLRCLPFESLTPDEGWGSPHEGLPFNGALALLCPHCADRAEEPIYALAAKTPTPLRILTRELTEPWPPVGFVRAQRHR